MAGGNFQEEEMAMSTDKPLTHQITDAQQEKSSNLDSSENNKSETQSSAVFPLVDAHPIDSAAPPSETIDNEHRANAIPPVAEQPVDPINAMVPVASTQSISGVASAKALKELQARCKMLEEKLAKSDRDLKAAQYNVMASRAQTATLINDYVGELKKQRNELLAIHREEIETLTRKAAEDAEKYEKMTARLNKVAQSFEKVPLLINRMNHMKAMMKLKGMQIELLKDRCAHLYERYADLTLERDSEKETYLELKEFLEELKEKHKL